MKITKRQLRRIIKEEKAKLHGWEARHPDLISLLKQAEAMAAMNDPRDEDAMGVEAQDLASALQDIWLAAGFDTREIFK